jgi:hypothetical protein
MICFPLPIEVARVYPVPKNLVNGGNWHRVFALAKNHTLSLSHLCYLPDREISRYISLKHPGDDRGKIRIRLRMNPGLKSANFRVFPLSCGKALEEAG